MMKPPVFWPRYFVMRNKRDLLARIERLEQLVERLNTGLVQVAFDREPFTQEERLVYCRAVEEMVHAATAALVLLVCLPFVGLLFAVPAVICGVGALRRRREWFPMVP
jgi:hypothetical protein